MSWPDDNEPRFIVREHSGYPMYEQGRQGAVERTEIMVMDRCYCHRVVWTSWNNPSVMHLPLDKQRLAAEATAENLEVSLA